MKIIDVKTSKRSQMVNISREAQEYVKQSGIKNGMLFVFVPHTTAGVSINENADPNVKRDVMFAMDRAVPSSGFLHYEGNSDAHTKAQMTGFSLSLIIENGEIMLGTWQSIYFCEYDGPRNRNVYIKVIKSED